MEGLSKESPWSADEVAAFLSSYVAPLRLAVGTDSGCPLLCSLWFVFEEGRLHCATQADAAIVRNLEKRPGCGFELAPNEPPYFGVRGQGTATIERDGAAALLDRLIDRYLGPEETKLGRWLRSRAESEVRIAITPRRLTAWDYRERMGDATTSGEAR